MPLKKRMAQLDVGSNSSTVLVAEPLTTDRRLSMLIGLAILLAIAWVLGFSVFHVSSVAIHVLIVLAVVSLVMHLIRGRRTT
jgi:exopolyphosphatase/pppGpp-phosphohydrolase